MKQWYGRMGVGSFPAFSLRIMCGAIFGTTELFGGCRQNRKTLSLAAPKRQKEELSDVR
jgi:hypothetical protein